MASYVNVRSSRVRDLGLKQTSLTQDEVVKIQNRVSKKACKMRRADRVMRDAIIMRHGEEIADAILS